MVKPDYNVIRNDPELVKWLTTGAWRGKFDTATQNRALPYSSVRLVKGLEFKRPLKHELTFINSSVEGTSDRPYSVLLAVSKSGNRWDLHTECSCPVEHLCKHAAATLAVVATALVGSAVAERDFVPLEITKWLGQIRNATGTAPKKDSASKTKPENRFLAYCVELSAESAGPVFVLRIGTRKKDGSVGISDSRANADLSRPPKYLVEEDFLMVSAYQRLHRRYDRWGDVSMEGEGWDTLLERALASGRLYFGRESHSPKQRNIYRPELDHVPLRAGPEETVEPVWENTPEGSMRPVLRAAEGDIVLLPVEPMKYLRPDSALIGAVRSDFPPALLSAWAQGPVIAAKHVETVTGNFLDIPAVALPTPKKIETVRHQGLAPTPHLVIGPVRGDSMGWSDAEITARLLVRYGDSRKLMPLGLGEAAAVHAETREGRRHIWQRDPAAELGFRETLAQSGFFPLSPWVSSGRTNLPAGNEFVLDLEGDGERWDEDEADLGEDWPDEDDSDFDPDSGGYNEYSAADEKMLWLAFLEGGKAAVLREAGWVIETEADAGLTLHDIGDFFPAIEGDPDHGIDWFSFDIAYEINGQKISLIPIIAQAIRQGLPSGDDPLLPEYLVFPFENPADGMIRFPARRLIEIVDQVRHLFHGREDATGPIRLDRLAAAGVADSLAIDGSATLRALAQLGKNLRNITSLPEVKKPAKVRADLRAYQHEGFQWLQFLAGNGLHGILADDMGLGKTVQTLTHLAAERAKKPGRPSLVIAPTSVVPNWEAEAEKFTPHLKTITLQGKDRAEQFRHIAKADIVFTSYPLLCQDFEILEKQDWHAVVLDEAQYIKNPKALTARNACKLHAAHRLCLSGTPMENHLGELWSLMRFLMPGFLADEKTFNAHIRRPIERERSHEAQLALNRRVAPLILRRTKDEVVKELPEKTEIIHGIDLNKQQTDLYESVRAAMDKRVRDAIADKGLAKSHIIVLDALLKLRQICCHPQLLKLPAAQKAHDSAKLDYLTTELLPTLIEEGRRILLFSTFTSMLAIIEEHLKKEGIPYLMITGQTQDRGTLVKKFQQGETPVFLISLKAGGTGLNLTAADTVIHYDPWWNPAAENQATDRAHRIGQTKPVFVHKLVCRGTIEDRILELQKHKSALVEALLSEETSKLRIDPETLGHLLSPIG